MPKGQPVISFTKNPPETSISSPSAITPSPPLPLTPTLNWSVSYPGTFTVKVSVTLPNGTSEQISTSTSGSAPMCAPSMISGNQCMAQVGTYIFRVDATPTDGGFSNTVPQTLQFK